MPFPIAEMVIATAHGVGRRFRPSFALRSALDLKPCLMLIHELADKPPYSDTRPDLGTGRHARERGGRRHPDRTKADRDSFHGSSETQELKMLSKEASMALRGALDRKASVTDPGRAARDSEARVLLRLASTADVGESSFGIARVGFASMAGGGLSGGAGRAAPESVGEAGSCACFPLTKFPVELQLKVFEQCEDSELAKLARTCEVMHRIVLPMLVRRVLSFLRTELAVSDQLVLSRQELGWFLYSDMKTKLHSSEKTRLMLAEMNARFACGGRTFPTDTYRDLMDREMKIAKRAVFELLEFVEGRFGNLAWVARERECGGWIEEVEVEE